MSPEDEPEQVLREVAVELSAWAKSQRARLGLDPSLPVSVSGFHPVHRIAASGELLLEMVAQLVQTQKTADDLGGLHYRAGVTLVTNIEGQIRYLIPKPFHERRRLALKGWVDAFDAADGVHFSASGRDPNRLMAAFSARAMDRRRWR